MSLQFCYNLGKIARASLSHARLNNPSFYGSTAAVNNNKALLASNNNYFNHQQVAGISTSKKNRETITADVTTTTKKEQQQEEPKKTHYWISSGFSWKSEEDDIRARNGVMFFTITIGIVLTGFVLMYLPDVKWRDWAQREAYIEIARREALGLPHIDPNIVPPENVNLPTEEELGDFEIII